MEQSSVEQRPGCAQRNRCRDGSRGHAAQVAGDGRALLSVDELPEGQAALQNGCEATQVAECQAAGKVCLNKACVQARPQAAATAPAQMLIGAQLCCYAQLGAAGSIYLYTA